MFIPFYAQTGFPKVYNMLGGNFTSISAAAGNLGIEETTAWNNTAAITSIKLTVPSSGHFSANTVIAVYGIN